MGHFHQFAFAIEDEVEPDGFQHCITRDRLDRGDVESDSCPFQHSFAVFQVGIHLFSFYPFPCTNTVSLCPNLFARWNYQPLTDLLALLYS